MSMGIEASANVAALVDVLSMCASMLILPSVYPATLIVLSYLLATSCRREHVDSLISLTELRSNVCLTKLLPLNMSFECAEFVPQCSLGEGPRILCHLT